MRVLVLGSGVIGTTSAWYLRQAGFEVTVIDRQPGPALERPALPMPASCRSATPRPGRPRRAEEAIGWLFDEARAAGDQAGHGPAQYRWLWRCCATARMSYAINKARMVRMSEYSRDCLNELRAQIGIEFEGRDLGTTQLFRTQQQLDASAQDIEILAQYGVPYEVLDRAGIIQAEPALAHVDGLVGALRLPRDQTGDCQLFTRRLAQMCVDAGVEFRFDQDITGLSLRATASPACASTASGKPPTASWSRSAATAGAGGTAGHAPAGVPAEGLFADPADHRPAMAPTSTILDESYKVAVTRFDDRIRVGGMAEVAGFDLSLSQRRRETLELVVSDLYPKGGDLSRAQFWTGLRPAARWHAGDRRHAVPQSLPQHRHGTLGWTMACGSGRYLADLMSARQPQISTEGLDIFRYGQYGHAPQHENRTCVLPAR